MPLVGSPNLGHTEFQGTLQTSQLFVIHLHVSNDITMGRSETSDCDTALSVKLSHAILSV